MGTEADLGDNVRQTIGRLGGHGLPESEVAAITAYMTGHMSLPDNPNPTSGPLVDRGRELFDDPAVGCSACHDGDAGFTDGELHDLGVADAGEAQREFNTPSLRHLWASAPCYHDGSSASLAHLLTAGNPDDRMGATAALTVDDRAALEAYLLSI